MHETEDGKEFVFLSLFSFAINSYLSSHGNAKMNVTVIQKRSVTFCHHKKAEK